MVKRRCNPKANALSEKAKKDSAIAPCETKPPLLFPCTMKIPEPPFSSSATMKAAPAPTPTVLDSHALLGTRPTSNAPRAPRSNDVWAYRENPYVLDNDDKNSSKDDVADDDDDDNRKHDGPLSPPKKRLSGRQVMYSPKLEVTPVQRSRRNTPQKQAVSAEDLGNLISSFRDTIQVNPSNVINAILSGPVADHGNQVNSQVFSVESKVCFMEAVNPCYVLPKKPSCTQQPSHPGDSAVQQSSPGINLRRSAYQFNEKDPHFTHHYGSFASVMSMPSGTPVPVRRSRRVAMRGNHSDMSGAASHCQTDTCQSNA
jgi:hypothetical protein